MHFGERLMICPMTSADNDGRPHGKHALDTWKHGRLHSDMCLAQDPTTTAG